MVNEPIDQILQKEGDRLQFEGFVIRGFLNIFKESLSSFGSDTNVLTFCASTSTSQISSHPEITGSQFTLTVFGYIYTFEVSEILDCCDGWSKIYANYISRDTV